MHSYTSPALCRILTLCVSKRQATKRNVLSAHYFWKLAQGSILMSSSVKRFQFHKLRSSLASLDGLPSASRTAAPALPPCKTLPFRTYIAMLIGPVLQLFFGNLFASACCICFMLLNCFGRHQTSNIKLFVSQNAGRRPHRHALAWSSLLASAHLRAIWSFESQQHISFYLLLLSNPTRKNLNIRISLCGGGPTCFLESCFTLLLSFPSLKYLYEVTCI